MVDGKITIFFSGLVFLVLARFEPKSEIVLHIYIYILYDILTNIGCPIAVSWWSLFAIFFEYLEEGFGGSCFLLACQAAMTEAPPERSDSEVPFRDAYFRDGWWFLMGVSKK